MTVSLATDLLMTVVVVTGATGLLGRSVCSEFKLHGFNVIGAGRSRSSDLQLELTDKKAVEEAVKQYNPDYIIHCAAERRPDVVEADSEGSRQLNVEATADLATLCQSLGKKLIFISTDYVFNGEREIYHTNDTPHPLNDYARQKVEAEKAVLQANQYVVRVPLLYGHCEYNAESAVNILLDVIQQKSCSIDNVSKRYPTCTEDVAQVLRELIDCGKAIPCITHCTASNSLTKYEMALIFCDILGISSDHIHAADSQNDTVKRPNSIKLSSESLINLGIDHSYINFVDFFKRELHAYKH